MDEVRYFEIIKIWTRHQQLIVEINLLFLQNYGKILKESPESGLFLRTAKKFKINYFKEIYLNIFKYVRSHFDQLRRWKILKKLRKENIISATLKRKVHQSDTESILIQSLPIQTAWFLLYPKEFFFGGVYIYFFLFHTCFKVVTYTKHSTWQKIIIEAFLFTCHSFSTPKVRRKGVSLRRMCAYVRGVKVVRLFPSYARKIE